MRMPLVGLLAALAAPLLACDGGASGGGSSTQDTAAGPDADAHSADGAALDGGGDAGAADAADVAADVAPGDAGTADAGPGDAGSGDAGAPDAGPGDVATADAGPGDVATADAGPGGPIEATPGLRCAPATRIGVVQILSFDGGPLDASAAVNDAPPVLGAPPAASDEACTYYVAEVPGFCDGCPPGTTCDAAGECKAQPAAVPVTLVIAAGGETQTFTPGEGGSTWGAVTLPGSAFSIEASWAGVTIHLGETAYPAPLQGVEGVLHGGLDQPTGLDLSWDPPADPGVVFTRIPINHHAAGPTATECAVPASAGSLHVDGSMLEPLAVVTGLEFQGIEHVRFAAAETPAGCVELRLSSQSYPNLTY